MSGKMMVLTGMLILLIFDQFSRIGAERVIERKLPAYKAPQAAQRTPEALPLPDAEKNNHLENIDVEKIVDFSLKPRLNDEVKANPVHSIQLMFYGDNLIRNTLLVFRPKEKNIAEVSYLLSGADERVEKTVRGHDLFANGNITFDFAQLGEHFFRKVFTTVKARCAESPDARYFHLSISKYPSGKFRVSVIIISIKNPQILYFDKSGDLVSS